MRVLVRWGLVVVVAAAGMGVAWLAASLLVLAAGALLVLEARSWWVVAAIAAVVSQTVILTAWADAAAGATANVLLLLAAAYGYAAYGPASFRSEYRRRVAASLNAVEPAGGTVTEADLAGLPEAVAAYVRGVGVVGHPRVTSFRARMHGRIRQGADRLLDALHSAAGQPLRARSQPRVLHGRDGVRPARRCAPHLRRTRGDDAGQGLLARPGRGRRGARHGQSRDGHAAQRPVPVRAGRAHRRTDHLAHS